MTVNARAKGARGELEVVHFLKDQGIDAQRGQQFAGGPGSPDVKHALPKIHIEVKRTNRLRLEEAYEQACNDAGDQIPTVWYRRDRGKWMVILSAEDFLKFRLKYNK